MGETSVKSIRGDKKSKFIFTGSATRKASKEAIGELEFDNTKRILPSVDSDSVVITRKANASGRSEVFINNKPCLLKDVQRIFLDTGLGRDSYSMISQEQSKKLLSERIDERRAIFEEAAGIVKMRSQKELSEKRLEEVTVDFNRLNDILKELEKQVKPLQKQSEKAQEYVKLKDKLAEIEINFIANKVQHLHSLISTLESQLALSKEENIDDTTLLASLENEVASLKQQIKNLNSEVFNSQSQLNEHSTSLESLRSEIKINKERISNSLNEIEETEVNINELQKQLDTSADEYASKRAIFNFNKAELDKLNTEKNELAKTLFTLSEESSNQKSSSEDLRNEITKIYNELQECKIRFEQSTKDEERLLKELDNTKAMDNSYVDLSSSINDLSDTLSKLRIDYDIKNESLIKLNNQIEGIHSEINRMNSEAQQLNNTLARETSIFSNLENSIENYDGFFEGVKNVLKNKDELYGVIDAVSNLIVVSKEYATAIDTLTSGFAQNIATDSIQDAKFAVNYLKQHNLGRATFIPLDDLTPKYFNEQELNAIQSYNGIWSALDVIDYKPNFEPLMRHLIGRNLIASDINVATEFYKATKIKAKIATLDGDVIQPGLISGGTKQSKRGLISKKQEIESLGFSIAEKEKKLAGIQKTLDNHYRSLQVFDEQRASIQSELSTLSISISEKDVKLSVLNKEAEANSNKNNSALVAIKELEFQLSESKRSSAALYKRREELEVIYQQKSTSLSQSSTSANTAESTLTSLKERETNLLIEISKLESENRSLAEFVAGQELGKDSISLKLESLVSKKAFANSRLELANADIDELIIKEADSLKLVELLTEQIERMVNNKNVLESNLTKQETELSELRERLKSSIESIHQLELELQNSNKSLESSLSNAKENYNLALEQLLEFEVTPFNEKQISQRIFDYKKDIKALGSVNLDSIKDFEELNARYISEKEQLDDIRNAKKDLDLLLSDISRVMSDKFVTTFKSIAKHFEETFVELFGGGNAKLSLSEPKKPLDSQVEIIAQPPGKKPNSLESLSGGEKNLTVCALVFAILKAKPSPFVYLDEIDAPLDDANVARFATYLQKIKGNTQFIVVTHRKGTMMASDFLFGVSQEIPGITTIFPYKLPVYEYNSEEGVYIYDTDSSMDGVVNE